MGRGAHPRKFDGLTTGFGADAARSAPKPAFQNLVCRALNGDARHGEAALRGARGGFAS